MSFTEILWTVHSATLTRLKEDNPRAVRGYLNSVKDYTALREWDKSQMKDSTDR